MSIWTGSTDRERKAECQALGGKWVNGQCQLNKESKEKLAAAQKRTKGMKGKAYEKAMG